MRIDKPLKESINIFNIKNEDASTQSTFATIRIIKNIDKYVENGQWSKTAFEWEKLSSLFSTLRYGKNANFKEYEQLLKYESWEKKIRYVEKIPENTMKKILYLKSSDINLYRRVFALENGIDADEDFFLSMRAVDVFRELIDDIIDYPEDLLTPNFNFLIFAKGISSNWIDLVSSRLDKLANLSIDMLVNSKSKLFENEYVKQHIIPSISVDKIFYQNTLYNNYYSLK